ncbi:MAG TPA: amidohydrolase [Firmicutes bacterium]|nr:amidohydrolase [Bacillota bacterium]HAZ23024.1 amidohydrolase [Bacillota bacterium]HCF90121.1 amidohydrolase [Bacillota bacterium]HCM17529.1 amidohydrolase [Bacillota bacterium]HCX72066.1 amidohydrolase [Bacillota bacterium]
MSFTMLSNGRIHTMDPKAPQTEAVVIGFGKILATGKARDLEDQFRPTCKVDLGGAMLLPGLVDAHVHLFAYAQRLEWIDLDGLLLEEALSRIAAAAKRIKPGEWLCGGGYNSNLWDKVPDRHLLDSVTADVPVVLDSKDFHTLWVNSALLKTIGVDANTPNPPGGSLDRETDGFPSGIIREYASALLQGKRPVIDLNRRAEIIEHGIEKLYSYGLTGVHAPEGIAELGALQKLQRADRLNFRVSVMLPKEALPMAESVGLQTGLGGEWLNVIGVKLFADGSLGSQTAFMLAPYENSADYRGIAVVAPEELQDQIARANRSGLAVAVHAIGDAAVRTVLDCLEAAQEEAQRWQIRNRIEHLQLITKEDLPRLSKLGVIASMQPLHCTSDIDIVKKHWGEHRGYAYGWRSVEQSGVNLAFGSDAPVEVPDPLQGIYAAATRKRCDNTPAGGWQPEETISVTSAIRAYTSGAAWAAGREKEFGTIEPGKAADFTVLDHDIIAEGPESILQTRVIGTMISGRWVYGG